MTGYFRKLVGHVFDGAHKAAVELHNGEFVSLVANEVALTAAAGDLIMRVAEVTYLFGKPALVADVVSVGEDEIYMVENEWDVEPYEETADYAVAAGALVKMKRPLAGEQLIFNVTAEVLATLVVGDLLTTVAGGTVAKKSI